MSDATLGGLAKLLRGQGDRALLARYPAPVLVIAASPLRDPSFDTPLTGTKQQPGRSTEETRKVDGQASPHDTWRRVGIPDAVPARADLFDPGQRVVPVVKSDRNPFTDVITVGRAKSNDIAIESPDVSKVHAWIRQRPGGLVISDNASTNGTFLDAVKLPPKVDHPLRPGLTVRFGHVTCRFVTPDDLVDLCAAIRG